MKKVMLADVLWEAANTWLSTSNCYQFDAALRDFRERFSCLAIKAALIQCKPNADEGRVDSFLQSLGVDTRRDSYTFSQKPGFKRQGVRYMWLLLAMHVAEDEGIEI